MEISVLPSYYLRKGTWKFLRSSPCHMARQGTWKFPCSFPCYLRKARYVEISKYLLAYVCKPLPNHMYFETDFKVFKMYFQYLNTILLYFNPV